MIDPIDLTVASMQNDVQRVNAIANHAANALTPGFKRSLVAVARSADLAAPPIQTLVTDLRPGIPRKTGLPLDVALLGEGFLEVKTDAGTAYTRAGALQLDDRGRLVTAAGHPVMGASGEIVLSRTDPSINRDGKILEKGNPVAQLKIVKFDDPQALTPLGNGLLMADTQAVPKEVAHPQVLQGHLESSNVDAPREMVSLIETFRHFETSQRLLQMYDDVRDKTFRSLGQF